MFFVGTLVDNTVTPDPASRSAKVVLKGRFWLFLQTLKRTNKNLALTRGHSPGMRCLSGNSGRSEIQTDGVIDRNVLHKLR